MSDDTDELKYVEVAPLGASFTPEARQRISDYLHSFVSFEPTLCLLYSHKSVNGSNGSWSVAAYGSQTVNEMVEMYAGFGSIVLYDLDGLDVLVPQLAHIADLESGTLGFVGDRICVVETAR